MADNLEPGDAGADRQNNSGGSGQQPTVTPEFTERSYGETAKRYAHIAKEKLRVCFKFVVRVLSNPVWSLLVSVAIFGATAAYSYFAIKQWREMKSAGEQTDRLLCLYQQQLEELKRQAADTSVLAKTAYINSRPWVVVYGTGFQYLDPVNTNGIPRVRATVIVTNTGPSPAHNVRFFTCGQVRKTEPDASDYRKGRFCVDQTFGLIGKDIPDTFNQDDSIDVVPKGSLAISTFDAGKHYYVWGKIIYDVTETDLGHSTTFCLISGPDKAQLGSCPHGNDGN